MTYQALNTAITGLRAAQSQLSAISNNVTNATTPGYNRQVLPQSTQVLRESGQTVGVLTERTIRVVDMNLQRDLWTQVSATDFQNVQVDYLQQIQAFHGPPDRDFSISAKLSELRDSFSALSDIPDDTRALEATLNQAQITAGKFNDYADLITQLRNDAQNDLSTSVNVVNGLLEEIVNINIQIRSAENFNHSVAGLQDERDIAIKSLTEQIDISFFERSDGVLVVQTKDGMELAGDVAHKLEFQTNPIGALQYYPDTASGVILINQTNNVRTETDITERGIGGRIGGLLELRDDTLPSYQAQLDELAYQTARRFEIQGLTLFTDQNGTVPADVIPDPNTVPPTSVSYVDFSRNMQVNRDVVNDPTLLRSGTATQDVTPPTGDNALIRRVVEFVFGDVQHEEAIGTVDLNVAAPATDLQQWLGLTSVNNVVLGPDFSSFPEINDGIPGNNDLIEQFQDLFLDFPDNDTFDISFDDPRTGLGQFDINVDLSHASENFPIDGVTINNALDQILAETNFQIANTPGFPPEYAAVATTNNYGQLVIQTTANVQLNGTVTLPIDGPAAPHAGDSDRMSPDALAALGLSAATFTTEDPNFTVQVGNNDPYTITIEPGDTTADLVAKLEFNPTTGEGVPGLFVDIDAVTGALTLRPGIDDSNFAPLDTEPVYGGDIKITGGPFSADPAVAANPTVAGASQPLSVVAALFGNFTDSGTVITETSVTSEINYSLQESIPVAPLTATFTNIRNEFLGPSATIETGIFSANNILDYAQKIVDETSQDLIQAQSALENEDTLRGILQRQFSDESGVNIDEEMSNLIIVQTAYAAAARVITSADEMFQELINSIR